MRYLMTLVFACLSVVAQAVEIVREQGFEVQVQPFPSTFLTQDVASIYGFERSRRQTLLNVVVLKVQADGQARGALNATVTGFSRNLLGQTQTLSFQEIDEGKDAIYYLAPVRVSSEEEIQIVLEVIPKAARAIEVNFRHRVYVD